MRISVTLLLLFFGVTLLSQNSFKAIVRDNETGEPLAGATAVISGTAIGAASDINGELEITNIPGGKQVLIFSYLGYEQMSDTIDFPMTHNEVHIIMLVRVSHEIDEIIITSTRSTRTIEDIPTRVEFIAREELEEKGNMKPGDIRMMLNESTGIQTQQTSATSYNSSIRIQGLDGRYTQLLRDGFPLYSGYSGGLSLLQIVPLDLSQVEVIKGASSTLYGGGAIAGLVNLVTKTPGEDKELNFLLNGTSALGLDVSGFYSRKFNKTGTTIFTSYNYGTPYDPAGSGLTAIPEFSRFTLNPKLYVYFKDTSVLSAAFNTTFEERTGGDIMYIKGRGDALHSWFEKNRTSRLSTQLGFETTPGESSILILKNSVGYYYRTLELPDFSFGGTQVSSFSEITLKTAGRKLEWIAGLNLVTDRFSQDKGGSITFNYNHLTIGGFVQNTYNISDRFSIESGLRTDYQDDYGLFTLPRLSALLKLTEKVTFRAGGGLGYKIPTVFTEDAERIHFRNILPVDFSVLKAEKSVGGNLDINYTTVTFSKLIFGINTLVFFTRIDNPLVLSQDNLSGMYEYLQPDGYIATRGIETNVRFTFNNLRLFLGYTLADVTGHYGGLVSDYPLVAKHRLNNILMYEIEDRLRIGLEAYFYSRQKLSDGMTGREHWIFGIMVEKIWKRFSLFLNFENITDTRQTRFDTIFTGPISEPVFREIYAPLDGFIVNGGCKIRIF